MLPRLRPDVPRSQDLVTSLLPAAALAEILLRGGLLVETDYRGSLPAAVQAGLARWVDARCPSGGRAFDLTLTHVPDLGGEESLAVEGWWNHHDPEPRGADRPVPRGVTVAAFALWTDCAARFALEPTVEALEALCPDAGYSFVTALEDFLGATFGVAGPRDLRERLLASLYEDGEIHDLLLAEEERDAQDASGPPVPAGLRPESGLGAPCSDGPGVPGPDGPGVPGPDAPRAAALRRLQEFHEGVPAPLLEARYAREALQEALRRAPRAGSLRTLLGAGLWMPGQTARLRRESPPFNALPQLSVPGPGHAFMLHWNARDPLWPVYDEWEYNLQEAGDFQPLCFLAPYVRGHRPHEDLAVDRLDRAVDYLARLDEVLAALIPAAEV